MPPDRSTARRQALPDGECTDRNITSTDLVQTPGAEVCRDLSVTVRFGSFLALLVLPIVLIRSGDGATVATAALLPAIAAANRSHLRFSRSRAR
ncbi:hypothetical protein GXW82_44050 [Streptacidiphilus sp. 4-A2]|nr:hypothetical protein [Streptacidiphilus sp. 4-A2]